MLEAETMGTGMLGIVMKGITTQVTTTVETATPEPGILENIILVTVTLAAGIPGTGTNHFLIPAVSTQKKQQL